MHSDGTFVTVDVLAPVVSIADWIVRFARMFNEVARSVFTAGLV